MVRTSNARTRASARRQPASAKCALLLQCCVLLVSCATGPDSTPSSRLEAEADLVVGFQSWNSIAFIKPDLTATGGLPRFPQKTFTRDGVIKLMNNLKMPRDFVVVLLDRFYHPDAGGRAAGLDQIQQFFQELGFRRVAFADGAAWTRQKGLPILRDTAPKPD